MSKSYCLLSLLGLVLCPCFARADLERKFEVEARGPLHEAYAQPWVPNPQPNQPIAQQPPEPIREEPPDQRPKGDNVQWIPGYWQWNEEKKDFSWISGFWREIPTGRRWVPGLWVRTLEGYRWISGHWAADQERDYQFVEPPPENPDQGPTTSPPDADSFYIPGTWFYGDSGYYYRDGYWAGCRPGHLWVPARYLWTPAGWAFCSGYWDLAIGTRGLLFAPVYFPGRAYLAAGFTFQPSYALSFDILFGSFFVYPGHGHYYYGDYYGGKYAAQGIRPWASYAARSYDPIYAHERWVNKANPNWAKNQQTAIDMRSAGKLAVPPRTLADQSRLPATSANTAMVRSLDQLRSSGARLDTVNSAQRTQQMKNVQIMQARSAPLISSATTSLKPSPAMTSAGMGAGRGGAINTPPTGGASMPRIQTAAGAASIPRIPTATGAASTPRIQTGTGAASMPRIQTGTGAASMPQIQYGTGGMRTGSGIPMTTGPGFSRPATGVSGFTGGAIGPGRMGGAPMGSIGGMRGSVGGAVGGRK